jgi:hypothetical protein
MGYGSTVRAFRVVAKCEHRVIATFIDLHNHRLTAVFIHFIFYMFYHIPTMQD